MSGAGRKRARRRIVYRGNSQNRLSMILVIIVMAAILIAVSVRGVYLNTKLAEYNAQIEELQAEIESENARTEEIEDYAKYVQTDEYVEEVARDKLGLVKEGEIIFRSDGDETSSSASESVLSESEDGIGEASDSSDTAETAETAEEILSETDTTAE